MNPLHSVNWLLVWSLLLTFRRDWMTSRCVMHLPSAWNMAAQNHMKIRDKCWLNYGHAHAERIKQQPRDRAGEREREKMAYIFGWRREMRMKNLSSIMCARTTCMRRVVLFAQHRHWWECVPQWISGWLDSFNAFTFANRIYYIWIRQHNNKVSPDIACKWDRRAWTSCKSIVLDEKKYIQNLSLAVINSCSPSIWCTWTSHIANFVIACTLPSRLSATNLFDFFCPLTSADSVCSTQGCNFPMTRLNHTVFFYFFSLILSQINRKCALIGIRRT